MSSAFRLTRRRFACTAAAKIAGVQELLGRSRRTIRVLIAERIGPNEEALAGMRAARASATLKIDSVYLDGTSRQDAVSKCEAESDVVVGLGSSAMRLLDDTGIKTPLIASMLLRGWHSPESVVSSITLDLPPSLVLTRSRALFSRARGWVVLGHTTQASLSSQWEAEGQRLREPVEFRAAANPRELLAVMQDLHGRDKPAICIPSRELFQPVTVESLILSSLRNQVPLIGFSESFVRAGAAAGVFPDYEDAGAQTAETAVAFLAGRRPERILRPRRARHATNTRVLRMLGLPNPQGVVGGVSV